MIKELWHRRHRTLTAILGMAVLITLNALSSAYTRAARMPLQEIGVGFIFQSFQLIPTLTAWENVALPLFPMKMPWKKRRERAQEPLEQMEMAHRSDHRPAALSGGEKQRVAIARAAIAAGMGKSARAGPMILVRKGSRLCPVLDRICISCVCKD